MGSVPQESDRPGFDPPPSGQPPHPPPAPPLWVCPGERIMLARWVMVGLTEADWPSRYLGRGIEARGLPGPSTCLVPLGEAAGLLCVAGSSVPRPLGWFEGQATLVNNPRRENGWGVSSILAAGQELPPQCSALVLLSLLATRRICYQTATTTAKIKVTRVVVFTGCHARG